MLARDVDYDPNAMQRYARQEQRLIATADAATP